MITTVYRIADDEGWEMLCGEEQIVNFAKERLDCSNIVPNEDDELNEEEKEVVRINKKYENDEPLTVQEALFIVKYDNWYLTEEYIH